MTSTSTVRLRCGVLALLCIPIGLLMKRSMPGVPTWIAGHAAGSLYVLWWCFLAQSLWPRTRPVLIAAIVLLLTCGIEFLQLWHPPFLQAIRTTRLGVLLLGTTFAWLDLPFYVVGAIAAWLTARGVGAPAPPRPPVSRRRTRRPVALLTTLLLSAMLGPYLIGRVSAPRNAVSMTRSATALPDDDPEIRIGCFNIAHGRGSTTNSNWAGGSMAERRDRLRAIGRFLRDCDLDVVVLNEVDFDAVWSGGVDQAKVIADAGEFPIVVRQRNADVTTLLANVRFGNAILSRLPVRTPRHVPLPAWSSIERLLGGNHDALLVTLDTVTGPVDLWALHLESRDAATRRRAADRVAAILGTTARPAILAGDLNSELGVADVNAPPTALDTLLRTGRFQPVPPIGRAGTFPANTPTRTIDWILVPTSWSVEHWQVPAVAVSDHRPVVATIRLQRDGSATGVAVSAPRASEPADR